MPGKVNVQAPPERTVAPFPNNSPVDQRTCGTCAMFRPEPSGDVAWMGYGFCGCAETQAVASVESVNRDFGCRFHVPADPAAYRAAEPRREAFLEAAAYHEREYKEARDAHDRLMARPDELVDHERGVTCADAARWFKRDCGIHRIAAWEMRRLAGLSPDEMEERDAALVGKRERPEAGR